MTGTRYYSSAPSAFDALSGLTAGKHMARTGNACWRNSYDVDDESCIRFAHAIDADEIGPILTEADRHSLETKDRGKRCGTLRTWGVAILRYLFADAKRNQGICTPSHQQIADALKIARSCVVRTLAALRSAGFIEWKRRTVVVDREGAGPRREQTSNLYRFTLPKAIAWRVSKYMVKRFGRKPGLPRSIAAALSPRDLTERAIRYTKDQIARRRKGRTDEDKAKRLLLQLSASAPIGLS
jgi:hypothetical protein